MALSMMCFLMVLLMSITKHSSGATAVYCICKHGLTDEIYQKDIDYACGVGDYCEAMRENGPCFQPNTPWNHCNYAVNSYYQSNEQVLGSCNFSNTTTLTQAAPGEISECGLPLITPRSSNQAVDLHRGTKFLRSLTVKITIVTCPTIILIIKVLVCLLKMHSGRTTTLNGAQGHEGAANYQVDLGGSEVEIVLDPASVTLGTG